MKNIILLLFTVYSISVFSQQFEISTSSSITVDGTSTLSDWTVKAEKLTGSVLINTKENSKNSLEKKFISSMSLLIPVKNIRSKKGETMDNKIYKTLKVEEFSNIKYSLINPIGFDTLGVNASSIRVSGILYIAGVQKTIHSQIEASLDKDTLTLKGKVQVKFSEFNLEPPSAMFGQIETGDDITINFNIKFGITK